MKQIKLVILFLALGTLFALPKMVRAEQIDNYNVNIVVNSDSSILVKEIINYDFGTEQRHGIYRDIPYKYQARGGNYKLEINVLSVTDERGGVINFETSRSGGMFKIKIGEANIFVTGQKTYVIKYKVGGAINYFSDHDELYWNVTGNDWQADIMNSAALVSLNGFDANLGKTTAVCYVGTLGVQKNCNNFSLGEKSARFINANLSAGEGLTIVVGWPKGFTKEPSTSAKIIKKIKDNGIILLPIIIFVFLYLYWRKNGQDPGGRVMIVPEYEAPAGILPAEAGVVYDEKYEAKDLTATIIDLARRGYYKIEETKKEFLGIKTGKDWKLVKLKKWDGERNYEHDLYSALMENVNEINLSKLRNSTTFSVKAKEIRKKIYDDVSLKGWFKSNPEKSRGTFVAIGWVSLLIIYFFGGSFLEISGIIGIISFVLSAILFLVFSHFMPKRTSEGVLMKEKLEGFKLFLSVTEKDRVSFHFSPAAHPEKFAEYLPWAIIFGVEKEWAGVFEGIDLPQPDWYVGSWSGNFTALALADSLGSFGNSFNKTAVGAAAAGGSSGFGGGGFSGGGFGGGGGGSW
ncbi:MAG TPA: DUF2207 domain-containing protein [Patescibacteria group bacterium]|nr:DUF2207 domain-containing protein [Patescibacteria group bacterium]